MNEGKPVDTAFLAGEIHAVLMFCEVIAQMCPDRRELRRLFESATQTGLATIEMVPASDGMGIGFQWACGELQKAISSGAKLE